MGKNPVHDDAGSHRSVDQMLYFQGSGDFDSTDPMKPGADGASALAAIRVAAEDTRLDIRFQVGSVIDRHFREKALIGALGWLDKSLGHASRQHELRKTAA